MVKNHREQKITIQKSKQTSVLLTLQLFKLDSKLQHFTLQSEKCEKCKKNLCKIIKLLIHLKNWIKLSRKFLLLATRSTIKISQKLVWYKFDFVQNSTSCYSQTQPTTTFISKRIEGFNLFKFNDERQDKRTDNDLVVYNNYLLYLRAWSRTVQSRWVLLLCRRVINIFWG